MWGQVARYVDNRNFVRIIPMRVGTRIFCFHRLPFLEDHPHACGDKFFHRFTVFCCVGSSPCVWGQEACSCSIGSNDRIIPMRVGTSIRKICKRQIRQDHPHACGDKFGTNRGRFIREGSSPCVWGQAFCFEVFTSRFRIIPMRVGTSVVQILGIPLDRDHPHACGDKPLCNFIETFI